MDAPSDPFSFHPELRDKIADPFQSFFRTFRKEDLIPVLRKNGAPIEWLFSDSEREASRIEALVGHRDADLWVFAYGSLMWDPAFRFEEVRRCHVPDYARRFILRDVYGGRGTPDAPGLMAALDTGHGCDGLLFRIARARIEEETEILWRRERLGPGYIATFVEAVLSDRRVLALTFVADHEARIIAPDLTREEQVRFLATGTGFLGTSLEYLENIADHFAALGIEDADVSSLLRDTEAYVRARRSG